MDSTVPKVDRTFAGESLAAGTFLQRFYSGNSEQDLDGVSPAALQHIIALS
jgi:hypothetical protein